MSKNGFTLIELLVVVAIIGIISSIGIYTYSGFIDSAKENTVLKQCSEYKNFMMSKLTLCALSPSSNLSLMAIGGQTQTQNYSCNRSANPTGTIEHLLNNHFNNIPNKNAYGNVGGHSAVAFNGGGVCLGGGGNCDSYDVLASNSTANTSLGRVVVQSQNDGHIAVTCFYDPGTGSSNGRGVSEALQWTKPERFKDPRP